MKKDFRTESRFCAYEFGAMQRVLAGESQLRSNMPRLCSSRAQPDTHSIELVGNVACVVHEAGA
jgi:hypothetical protein